jgi:hypothetical protein
MAPKPGHPLQQVPGFPPASAQKLRDELSISTGEEFLDLAGRFTDGLRRLLGAGPDEIERLRDLVRAVLPAEQVHSIEKPQKLDYPFRTGHDAPPSGKQTFSDTSRGEHHHESEAEPDQP